MQGTYISNFMLHNPYLPTLLLMLFSIDFLHTLHQALQRKCLTIMILLRLSPLIPYNALDYMSGITSIPLWAYSLAMFAMLPGTVMFCFLGASASSLVESTTKTGENKTVQAISITFGIAFAVAGVYAASYYSKQELDRVSPLDKPRGFLRTSTLVVRGVDFACRPLVVLGGSTQMC